MNRLPRLHWSTGRRLPAPLLALLAAGVVAGGGLTYWQRHLSDNLAVREQQIERARELSVHLVRRRTPVVPTLSPATARQLQRQAGLLNRDWARLSSVLTPSNGKVSLLSLDVDPTTRIVRISGRVDGTTAANTYAEQLSKHVTTLRQVRLLSLESGTDGVRFEIGAQWIE